MSVPFCMVFLCVSTMMNTRRTPARIVDENDVNEEIPPQVEQGAQDDQQAQGDRNALMEGGNDVSVVHP